jgi:ABC-2 type transport system permease protein
MSIARSYGLMLRFDLASARAWLPFLVGLQLLLGVGSAVMYGFYIPNLTKAGALFIVTGAPTIALVPIGMMLLPMQIGLQKTARTFDFTWSLPVPRAVTIASTLTVHTLMALPGIAVTLILASLRYGVELTISPSIVPAIALASLMSASVGMGLAHGIREPVITAVLTNMLMFVAMMFAPIAMPIQNFPDWLATIHRVLPLYHMGVVVRAGLSNGLVTDVGTSYLVLGAWTIAGWAVVGWVIGRRR